MKRKITIGQLLKEGRRVSFMTQQQLAELFDTDQGNISKMENDLRNIPRKKVDWLTQTLGVRKEVVRMAWLDMDLIESKEKVKELKRVRLGL